MNSVKKLALAFAFIGLIISACSARGEDAAPESTITSQATDLPQPTVTPLPSTPYDIDFPECIPGGDEGTMRFDEVIDGILPSLFEKESYRYRAVYLYYSDGDFLEDELALEIKGEYSGLLDPSIYDETSTFLPIAMISQYFEESHTVITDLHSNLATETVMSNDGVWFRVPDHPEWIFLKDASRANLVVMPERYDPYFLTFMTAGAGTLSPGIRTGAPDRVTTELVEGIETIHRCWVIPASDEYDISGYLIHWDSLYTFLGDIEAHLWTVEDDSQLFRMAIRGTHVGERYFDYGQVDHDDDREFILWLELSDVNEEISISPPTLEERRLEIHAGQHGQTQITATYQDFPIPEDARSHVFEYSDEYIEQFEWLRPREYINEYYELHYGFLNGTLGSGWDYAPDDRLPSYETDISLIDTVQFYLDQQGERGWLLEEYVFRLSESENRAYLVFYRDGVPLGIYITGDPDSPTIIEAVLPPDDETIRILQTGWRKYTQANSGLTRNDVEDIAFDGMGRAWMASPQNPFGGWTSVGPDGSQEIPLVEGGLTMFDGEIWTPFTSEDTAVPADSLRGVLVDNQDRVWVSSARDLHMFNGMNWRTYTVEELGLDGGISGMELDQLNRIWISVSGPGNGSGLCMYDSIQWHSWTFLHSIESLVIDQNNRPIVGTNGGGVYVFSNGDWHDISIPDTEYGGYADISSIAVDQSNRIWVHSDRDGLRVWNGEDWDQILPTETHPHIANPEIFSLDDQDQLWAVTYEGRVYMLDVAGNWHDYTPLGSMLSLHAPNVIEISPEGEIWIGTRYGVGVFNPPVVSEKTE